MVGRAASTPSWVRTDTAIQSRCRRAAADWLESRSADLEKVPAKRKKAGPGKKQSIPKGSLPADARALLHCDGASRGNPGPAALGFVAGINALYHARGQRAPQPSAETAHGALLHHLRDADAKRFQPMNVNYGLFPPIQAAAFVAPAGRKRRKLPKREKYRLLAERALQALEAYRTRVGGAAVAGMGTGDRGRAAAGALPGRSCPGSGGRDGSGLEPR